MAVMRGVSVKKIRSEEKVAQMTRMIKSSVDSDSDSD